MSKAQSRQDLGPRTIASESHESAKDVQPTKSPYKPLIPVSSQYLIIEPPRMRAQRRGLRIPGGGQLNQYAGERTREHRKG